MRLRFTADLHGNTYCALRRAGQQAMPFDTSAPDATIWHTLFGSVEHLALDARKASL
jgi:hypothetical protein